MNKELYRKGDRIDIEKLRKDIIQSKLDTAVKCKFMEYISSDPNDGARAFEALRKMVYEFLNAGQAFEQASDSSDIVEWVHAVANHLEPKLVKENSAGETLYTKADIELAEEKGCSPREVAQWRKENHYTWHECKDMKTMQKVPSVVHNNIPHSGGISEAKKAV